jgi:hypothetical protein
MGVSSAHTGCIYRRDALAGSRAVACVRGAVALTVIMDVSSAHTGYTYRINALNVSRATACVLPAGERGRRTPDPKRKYKKGSGDPLLTKMTRHGSIKQ